MPTTIFTHIGRDIFIPVTKNSFWIFLQQNFCRCKSSFNPRWKKDAIFFLLTPSAILFCYRFFPSFHQQLQSQLFLPLSFQRTLHKRSDLFYRLKLLILLSQIKHFFLLLMAFFEASRAHFSFISFFSLFHDSSCSHSNVSTHRTKPGQSNSSLEVCVL